jgi:hypothetical protein
MRRIRKRVGDRPFIGCRINSTSFWDGDLEIEDIKRVHADCPFGVNLVLEIPQEDRRCPSDVC